MVFGTIEEGLGPQNVQIDIYTTVGALLCWKAGSPVAEVMATVEGKAFVLSCIGVPLAIKQMIQEHILVNRDK